LLRKYCAGLACSCHGQNRAARAKVMHKTQYDEKRLALAEAGNVDDIYDLLAAHEHKVSTGDQARAPRAPVHDWGALRLLRRQHHSHTGCWCGRCFLRVMVQPDRERQTRRRHS